MRAARLAISLVVTGCADPSIHVSFDVPEAYRDTVESVGLALLVPPVGTSFDCDDVAFGAVSASDLEAALLEELTTRESSAELAGIPREGDKLFVATGRDASGVPAVAGCAQLGDVGADTELAIAGEPTSSAALPELPLGGPVPASFVATALDIAAQPLAGIEVRWTLTAPGDEVSTGSSITDGDGRAEIAPEPPSLAGPIAVDVRPRWVRSTPPSVFAFGAFDTLLAVTQPGPTSDPPVDPVIVAGRLGPAGELGVAALGPTDAPIATGRQVTLIYHDAGSDPPFRVVSSPAIPGAFTLGVVSEGARDQLFTVTASEWIEIEPSGTLVPSPTPMPGRPAVRVLPVGGCAGDGSNEVMVVWSDDSVGTFGPDGIAASSPFDDEPTAADISAAGCTVSADGGVYRAAVYDRAGARPSIVIEMDEVRRGELSAGAATVGFAPAVGGAGPFLIIAELALEGSELRRYRAVPLGNRNLDLELVTVDPTPALPASLGGGDIDGDGELDLAALLTFGDIGRRGQLRVFTALEVDHLGDRLRGLSAASDTARPTMLVVDLDADGTHELAIATPTALVLLVSGNPGA